LRESLESEPELPDAQFIEHAQASDIDYAVVGWLHETLAVSAETIGSINALVDRIVPQRRSMPT
jgi:mannitol-1-phosphate/altronate dehydrogenase